MKLVGKRALVWCLLFGCNTVSPTGITSRTCATDSTLTYASFGSQVIADSCLSCHATQRPILSTQAQIKANASAILQQAVYTDAMPADSDMAISDREMLGNWLACGAP